MFVAWICEERRDKRYENWIMGSMNTDHKLSLAIIATVNGSARAPYRLAIENVVDRLTCGPYHAPWWISMSKERAGTGLGC